MVSIARPPPGLYEVVQNAISNHQHDRSADTNPPQDHPSSPPSSQAHVHGPASSNRGHEWKDSADGGREGIKTSLARRAEKQPARDQPGDASPTSPTSRRSFPPPSAHGSTVRTPQQRTGPPRSISYNYSISSAQGYSFSPGPSRQGESSRQDSQLDEEDPDRVFDFPQATSPFRSALDYNNPEQRERERSIAERKHKRRESSFYEVTWNPIKWITESPLGTPREELPEFQFPDRSETEGGHRTQDSEDGQPVAGPSTTSSPKVPAPRLRQSKSMPHIPGEARSAPSTPKWGRLRSLLPHIAGQGKAHHRAASTVTPHSVSITDELITGGLATLMLRFWVERDEKGHRRVPALFHRLRIRVTDSLHPMHGHKAVFRIECEYANGAVRWVVYRQLREFLSLHGHYALSKAYNRNIETMPEFPMTTLPYFKFLKERGSDVGKADFARLQREALENYLVGLIRAVMFHPAVNRLSAFLEIGALTVALALSGGHQYRAGFLRLEGVAPKPSYGPRAAGWRERKKQRWCCVRESYLAIMEEMGELTVYDVFLIDQDFAIERPVRY
ncbi:hypothetical protein V8D89_007695, partial [Ganoderma adspersum]